MGHRAAAATTAAVLAGLWSFAAVASSTTTPSSPSTATATPASPDRTAYLAQASRAGPDEIVARNFLAKAAGAPQFFDETSLLGPAAPAVVAWLGSARERCTPPGTVIELDCRTRGLVDAAQMVYIASPDLAREWAVVALHTSPDEGNVGYDRIVLFRKGAGGYSFQAVADTGDYQSGHFADDAGAMTYVGYTGSSGEAMEGKGPRQRFRIVGTGTEAKVVPDGAKAVQAVPPAPDALVASAQRRYQDEADAVETVRAIHRGGPYGIFGSKVPGPMRPYLTPALIDAWFKPASTSAYDFDGDPLTWTQMTDAVAVVSATPHDFSVDRGVVTVVTRVVVEDIPRTVTVDWLMHLNGNRWLADDNRAFGRNLRRDLVALPDPRPFRERASLQIASATSSVSDYTADHNGSAVLVSPRAGIISYLHASRTMTRSVDVGTVLFRGRIASEGLSGTAYTFKRGCPPAPYAVTGHGYAGSATSFVLIGYPPVRLPGGCAVVGYAEHGANAVLHFEAIGDGGDL